MTSTSDVASYSSKIGASPIKRFKDFLKKDKNVKTPKINKTKKDSMVESIEEKYIEDKLYLKFLRYKGFKIKEERITKRSLIIEFYEKEYAYLAFNILEDYNVKNIALNKTKIELNF